MHFLAEAIRLADWRRASTYVWVPFLAWVLAALTTNLILILAGGPDAHWRILASLTAGTVASYCARSIVSKKRGKAAEPES